MEYGETAEIISQNSLPNSAPSAPMDCIKPVLTMHTSKRIEPDLRGRMPVLDGLRGIAVLMVIAFHTMVIVDHIEPTGIPEHSRGITALDEGALFVMRTFFTSVDLFFVLSGFLITGILLGAKGQPGYFSRFYIRRVLRIFPLYYLLLIIWILIVPMIAGGTPEWIGSFAGEPVYYWTYLANFAIASGGVFRHKALDVTWTLSIEEQFYVVWPVIVALLSRRGLMAFSALIVLIALASRCYLLFVGMAPPTTVYVLTSSRMDGIGVGAFLACAMRAPGGARALVRPAKILFAICAPLAAITFWYDGSSLMGPHIQSVGYTLVTLIIGCVFVFVLTLPESSAFARGLSSRGIGAVGRMSYAMYLSHLPIQAGIVYFFLRDENDFKSYPVILGTQFPAQFIFFVLTAVLAYLVAMASYRWIEKPIMSLKAKVPMPGTGELRVKN
ncbi:MAG: acyltransferase [Planctomycetes bacterium]|nr:acyltransferase [Planctomycetota bacterium]